MSSVPSPTRRAEFLAGVRVTIPLAVGAAPFGMIFGALAVASGISPLGAAGMSLFVFAGSSQFIAWRSRNLLLTIVLGMAFFLIWRAVVAA